MPFPRPAAPIAGRGRVRRLNPGPDRDGLIGPVPRSERARSPYPRQLSATAAAIMAGTQTPRDVAERARCSPQAALMLARTYASVANRRYFLRHQRHITECGELDDTISAARQVYQCTE